MIRTKCLRCTCFYSSVARQVNSARLDLSVSSASTSVWGARVVRWAGRYDSRSLRITSFPGYWRLLYRGVRRYGVACSRVEYAWICLYFMKLYNRHLRINKPASSLRSSLLLRTHPLGKRLNCHDRLYPPSSKCIDMLGIACISEETII